MSEDTSTKLMIEREGYLTKQGFNVKSWKRRWFTLVGQSLYYFESPQGLVSKGVINLDGASVKNAETYMNKNFCFEVFTEARRFFLVADSAAEMEQWMEVLEAKITGGATAEAKQEGFLQKRGLVNKAYKRRWFVLENNTLFYFRNPSDPESAGQVALSEATVEQTEEEAGQFQFRVVTPQRTFYIAGDSAEDTERWIRAIQILKASKDASALAGDSDDEEAGEEAAGEEPAAEEPAAEEAAAEEPAAEEAAAEEAAAEEPAAEEPAAEEAAAAEDDADKYADAEERKKKKEELAAKKAAREAEEAGEPAATEEPAEEAAAPAEEAEEEPAAAAEEEPAAAAASEEEEDDDDHKGEPSAEATQAHAEQAAIPEPMGDDAYLKALREGFAFTKYGKKGKPHPKHVFTDEKYLYWCDVGKKVKDVKRSIKLSTIDRVVRGKQTDNFARSNAKNVDGALCFSILAAERNLDLSARTEEEATQWLKTFQSIVE